MKLKFTLFILSLIPFYAFGQNVGVGQSAPTNTLHITPTSSSDPIRIDGLQLYGMADTSILMVNPTTGLVKYILPADLVRVLGLDFVAGPGITIVGNTITNTASDVPVVLTGAGSVSISGTYPNFTISGTDNVNDADSNPTNELITGATLTGTMLTISDAGGATNVNLSSLQDGVNDADSDPANELNTGATLTGTMLGITDAGGTQNVDLSPLQDGVNDADAVIGNEYNTGATLTGTTLNIIDGGGSQSVNLSSLQDGVNDADSDPTNEHNTNVTLTGTTLNVIDGGGTQSQDLSSLRDHDWYESTGTNPANAIADNIYTQGNVAIGKTNATQKLDVAGNIKLDDNVMVEGNSTARIYRNLVTYNHSSSGSAGVFIINTQMPWNLACMFTVNVEGYFYDASAPFETKIGAYMYVNNDFVNKGFTNTGGKVLDVRLGRNSAGNIAIILGTDGASYSYPKISVTSFLQSHANIVESRADGWTITRAANTSGLTFVTNVPDVTRTDGDSVIGNEYNTGATLSGTTLNIVDGGGTQSVNLSALQDGVNDADSNPANEFNTGATLTGTTLNIVDGGGTQSVNLSSLGGDADWTVVGSNQYSAVSNNVGIGVMAPQYRLDVLNGTGSAAAKFMRSNNEPRAYMAVTNDFSGAFDGITGFNIDPHDIGVLGVSIHPGSPTDNYGIYGYSSGWGGTFENSISGDFVEIGGNNHPLRVFDASATITPGMVLTAMDANGNTRWQAPGGSIGGVTAGAGLSGGGTTGTLTINALANNGLNVDATADRIQLGGALTEATTITNGAQRMMYNLNGTGDFVIRDNNTPFFGAMDNGRIGIGTEAPAYKLHTIGDIYANGGWFRVSGNNGLTFQTHGGGLYMIDGTWIRTFGNKSFYHNTGAMRTDGTLQVGGSGATLNVPNGGNFAYRTSTLFANTAGNVGIGTNAPAQKLHVIGTGRFSALTGISNRLVMSNSAGDLVNLAGGAPGQLLSMNGAGNPTWISTASTDAWLKSGNAGVNPASQFLGTTDLNPLVIKTNNTTAINVSNEQIVGLGGVTPGGISEPRLYIKTSPTERFNIGQYTEMQQSSIIGGDLVGDEKVFNTVAADIYNVHGERNTFTGTSNRAKYGVYNLFDDVPGTKYAVYNSTTGASTGTSYGIYNINTNTSTSSKYGVRNYFSGAGGTVYSTYNYVLPSTTGTFGTKYGTYNFIGSAGGGARYGTYNNIATSSTSTYSTYGVYSTMGSSGTGSKYGVYSTIGSGTTGNTYAGYFNNSGTGINSYAAIFNRGHVVANEASGDYDFRMESLDNDYAFWLDANENLVNFGSPFSQASSNGATVTGVLVDYVADFDNGTATGTAIGIGSIEFLLDGSNETTINNTFSPTTHINRDLGYSTLRAWDDVFADDFVNVSDRREKNNIENLTYGLPEIMAMRPVSYKLNRDESGETKLGLIAQEVLPLVSEAVKTHDRKILDESTMKPEIVEMERMGMKYQQLIPVLIKATQEQQAIIEKLTDEIDRLNERLLIQENAQPVEANQVAPTPDGGK